MKWFKRWIARVVEEGNSNMLETGSTTRASRGITLGSPSAGDVEAEDGLNITIRSATGGKIVSFRRYDNKTDRSVYKLYIIPEDLSFEKELTRMITLESMR